MPGATTLRLVDPAPAIDWKADMMPQTVPKSPMYGEIDAVVARNATRCSSRAISVVDARSNARSTPSMLLRVGRDAASPGRESAGARICAVSSAYPDWNNPTSGLAGRLAQLACTSEKRLLLRNTPTNAAFCRAARPRWRYLYITMPHDAAEKSSRIAITACTTG